MYIWREKGTKIVSLTHFETEKEAIHNASCFFLREVFRDGKKVIAEVEIYKEVKTVKLIENRNVEIEVIDSFTFDRKK